jgi:hypothetical protein
MLNIYKYYDDPQSLPLYNELKSALPRLLHPSRWWDENYTREDFKPVEHIIIRNPETSYYYASSVLHSRFPEAEPYIMKDTSSAFIYAKDVIKGRWPEAEPYIKENERYWNWYRNELGIE